MEEMELNGENGMGGVAYILMKVVSYLKTK
jgi:hypothetical protein